METRRWYDVSILILLDYLFLFGRLLIVTAIQVDSFNPYFTGLPILIIKVPIQIASAAIASFNPYFTGLPILISIKLNYGESPVRFQSLFYWITYSYK